MSSFSHSRAGGNPEQASSCSPLRLAANRRNALKSTGPKTAAGKRRVALNGLRRSLCSEELEKELRSRGQDPREFRDLHRDLITIFHPKAKETFVAVELLARTWWEKACRIRDWVGTGPPETDRLDAQLEKVMDFLVLTKQVRHEWWRTELTSVFGRRALPDPSAVRNAVESRLSLFGGRPGRRRYPRAPRRAALIQDLLELKRRVVEAEAPKAASKEAPAEERDGKSKPNQTH